jgi:hypothetical protein
MSSASARHSPRKRQRKLARTLSAMGGRATASTGNLPAELTSFIGRRRQVKMSKPGSPPDAWNEASWMAEAPEVVAPVFERFWSSPG